MKLGIIGLPQSGKTTIFNALTRGDRPVGGGRQVGRFEVQTAVVPVPDPRVDKLAALVKPEKTIYTTVEFIDIAGLVKGASQGEGLGNQFLANIRETAVIVHIVRCFDDDNVVHVSAHPDPRSDIEVINTELMLADLQQLERKIERLAREVKGDKRLVAVQEVALALQEQLGRGVPVAAYPDAASDAFHALNKEMRFLTGKKVIYVANVDEDHLAEDNAYVQEVRAIAAEQNAEFVKLCAKLEQDMAGLSDEERHEYLAALGVSETGLEQVIHKGYHALGLISFFTTGPKEVRAWTVRRGAKAPEAAGVIHTDFERGFIRAEVITFDTYIRLGTEAAVKAAGEMRVEGREYVVQDGDVMHFRFNV